MATEKVRNRILDTARDLFLEKTVQGANMRDIARLANYSRATIHSYYRTKDDLLEAVIRRELRVLHKTVPSPSGNTRKDLRDDLMLLATNFYDFYSTREFLLLAIPDIVRNDKLQKALSEEQHPTIMKLTYLYGHYRDKNAWGPRVKKLDLKDINDVVSTPFLGGIFWWITISLLKLMSDKKFEPEEYVDSFLDGYGNA